MVNFEQVNDSWGSFVNFSNAYPISGQCSHFIPPEKTIGNLWFSDVFRGYKIGTLARNGSIHS